MSTAKKKNTRQHWLTSIIGSAHLVFGACLTIMLTFPLSAAATSAPTISPGTGLYGTGPTISMSATSGTIYYTLDGSEVTTSSPIYHYAFVINGTTTISAMAVASGVASNVATSTITVDPAINAFLVNGSPVLWLRSDIGISSDISDKISKWIDISGNGNSATQATISNQPLFLENDYNGFPSVALSTNTFFNLPSGFANLPEPNLYFVTKPNGSSNGVLLDVGNGSVSDNVQASTDNVSTTFTINDGSTEGSITASSALNLGQYQLLSMNQTTSNGYIDVNDVRQAVGELTAPNDLTRTENHVGADYSGTSNFYDGKLLEAIVFSNGVNLEPVENYLITRYQLLTATPTAPIISVPTSTLDGPTQVAIATQPNCTCYITTDGSTPSADSAVYSGPINIYYSLTLKSIAISNGTASGVSSTSYTLDSSRWPAPDSSDTRPLQLNIQAPIN